MWHRLEHCSRLSCRYWRLNDRLIAADAAAEAAPNAFQWGGQPPKLPIHAGISPPSNTWFIGPTRVCFPNGISIRWAIWAQHVRVINKQTHRPRYGRCIHLVSLRRCASERDVDPGLNIRPVTRPTRPGGLSSHSQRYMCRKFGNIWTCGF